MRTQTLNRYTDTSLVNAFRVGKKELEGIVNSDFDKVILLDTNSLVTNNDEFGRTRYNEVGLDEKSWEELLDPHSNVYANGVVMEETKSAAGQLAVQKIRENEYSLDKKVLKRNRKKGLMSSIKNQFSDMSFALRDDEANSHYKEASRRFNHSSGGDKCEGIFQYFMTLGLDAANDMDNGLKDQSNVIFDVYNVAMSLLVSEEMMRKNKDTAVYFLSRDQDVPKIVNGMFNKADKRSSSTQSETEKELIEKFYDATELLHVGKDRASLSKYLMHN